MVSLRLSAALLLLPYTIQATRSFGVGFHLSEDYGVASVAFQEGNQSWAQNIAKIAGSRLYTLAMDSASVIPNDIEVVLAEVPDPNEPQEITCGNHLFDLWEPIPPQAPLGLQLLYDRLPPRLGGGSRTDEATRALAGMLRALKTATESALDADIEEADISTPLPVGKDFNLRLKAASSAVGLKQPSDAFWAPISLSKGSSTRCSCDDPPSVGLGVNKLVLVLDHGQSALTATLAITTDCLLDALRILSSKDLGAWGLRNLHWSEYDSEAEKDLLIRQRYHTLVDALRRLIALPSNDLPIEEEIAAVDRVILLGETADDEKLQSALEAVFGERLGSLLASNRGTGSVRSEDPLYTVADDLARCSLHSKKLRSERSEL